MRLFGGSHPGPDFAVQKMVELNRIIVVDNGDRSAGSALSAELAELGFASVTTSLEAADEVLALLPAPAAIVLQLPRVADSTTREAFAAFAARVRSEDERIPVILIDPRHDGPNCGYAAMLQAQVGSAAFARPDHS
jgi:hypothetical protein